MTRVRLRAANLDDVGRISEIVEVAYSPWVDRIGIRPRPMDDDYAEVVARGSATVAEREGKVLGVLVTRADAEGNHLVDNLAVEPCSQGAGVGRSLLALAEDSARVAGADSIYLFTHERMIENIGWYFSLGYAEFERRPIPEGSLVYMRKPLTEARPISKKES